MTAALWFTVAGLLLVGVALAISAIQRLPLTTGIVLRNRLNGPEQVMQLAEERAPEGFARIGAVIPRTELEEVAARYKRVAGFDLERLRTA